MLAVTNWSWTNCFGDRTTADPICRPGPTTAGPGQPRSTGPGHPNQADQARDPHRRIQHLHRSGPGHPRPHRLRPREPRSTCPHPPGVDRQRRHRPRRRRPDRPPRPPTNPARHHRYRATVRALDRDQNPLPRNRPHPALRGQTPPLTSRILAPCPEPWRRQQPLVAWGSSVSV